MSAIRPELQMLRRAVIAALYSKLKSNTLVAKALGYTPSNITQAIAAHGLTGEYRPDDAVLNDAEVELLQRMITALKAEKASVSTSISLTGDAVSLKTLLTEGFVIYHFNGPGMASCPDIRPSPRSPARPKRSDAPAKAEEPKAAKRERKLKGSAGKRTIGYGRTSEATSAPVEAPKAEKPKRGRKVEPTLVETPKAAKPKRERKLALVETPKAAKPKRERKLKAAA